MARFGMEGHAGGNGQASACARSPQPVVLRFRREGKSDDARKSRVFNNLGHTLVPGRGVVFKAWDLL